MKRTPNTTLLIQHLDQRRSELLALVGVTEEDIDRLRALLSDGADFSRPPGEVAALLCLMDRTADHEVVAGDLQLEQEWIVEGDLRVKGNVLNDSRLVVFGDLRIDGSYLDGPKGNLLAVGGNLSLTNLDTEQEIIVLGGLSATETVHGTYNDHSLVVSGTLSATVLCEDDHEILAGKLIVGHHLRSPLRGAQTKSLFVDSVLSGDAFNRSKYRDVLKGNRSTLRSDARAAEPVGRRLAALVELATNAAHWSFEKVGGQPALKIVRHDGAKQISLLDEEEHDLLQGRLLNSTRTQ